MCTYTGAYTGTDTCTYTGTDTGTDTGTHTGTHWHLCYVTSIILSCFLFMTVMIEWHCEECTLLGSAYVCKGTITISIQLHVYVYNSYTIS